MPDITTADATCSFDPDSDILHYAYLRIDPNNVNLDGSSPSEPTSTYLTLKLNGNTIDSGDPDWSNPINVYLWGVFGGTVLDPYKLADNGYKLKVELTVTDALGDDQAIQLTNVDIEGCYAPVARATTFLLLGSGILAMAMGYRGRCFH